MFDTMTVTKALGSVCGALLFLLLAGWAAEGLYHTGPNKGEELAFFIELDDGDTGVAEAVEAVPFEELLAQADAERGARAWSRCRACHALEDGQNGVGPHLYAIVGREKAAVEGFNFSDALASMDGAWTPEALNEFLLRPATYAPGNRMSFAGIPRDTERADLIAYLQTIGN